VDCRLQKHSTRAAEGGGSGTFQSLPITRYRALHQQHAHGAFHQKLNPPQNQHHGACLPGGRRRDPGRRRLPPHHSQHGPRRGHGPGRCRPPHQSALPGAKAGGGKLGPCSGRARADPLGSGAVPARASRQNVFAYCSILQTGSRHAVCLVGDLLLQGLVPHPKGHEPQAFSRTYLVRCWGAANPCCSSVMSCMYRPIQSSKIHLTAVTTLLPNSCL
jgi:hypothetical protein